LKGDAKVIEILNNILTAELTAINQYFLHSRMCSSWGYEALGKKIWEESIDEMKHAQKLTDRILFLEGLPNLQKIGKLNIGENVTEILKSDLDLEFFNIPQIRTGIKICLETADHATRELLEHILVDEEQHVDWLEAQIGMIKDMGIENYLAEKM
jgi:bacterioferritin